MFSATISREVMDISWVYQRDPVEIVVRPVQENQPKISQFRIKVDMGGKVDLLAHILEKEHLERVIVFCNTKNTTDRITGLLQMDIDDVDGVINYDIPEEGEYYVHRIGRTGRAKHQGKAYNLISSVTDDVRLDGIIRNNRYDVKTITL